MATPGGFAVYREVRVILTVQIGSVIAHLDTEPSTDMPSPDGVDMMLRQLSDAALDAWMKKRIAAGVLE